MGTTAEKINYAINATNDIAVGINNIGGNITQNTELADFKDELDILYRQMPKVSLDGTSVSLAGTRRGKLEITPKGNTSQENYEGKNLCPTNLLPITANGLTISKDANGNIIINGTPNYSSGYKSFTIGESVSVPANKYSVSLDTKVQGIGFKSGIPYGDMSMADTNNTTTTTLSVDGIIAPVINIRYDVGTLENYILNPQIEIGTPTDYEPYTGGQPSPNPDYPQDIKIVTGENTVKISGFNLVNENNLTSIANIDNITNKIVTSNSLTNTGSAGCNVGFPELNIETGDYYISADIRLKSGTVNSLSSIQMWTRSSWTVSASWVNNPSLSNEFQRYVRKYTVNNIGDISNTIYSFYTQLSNPNNAVLEIKNIQISRTNVNYEPYIEPMEKELNLTSKNLFDGIWESGSISDANGTNEVNNRVIRSKNYISVKPNTEYTVSAENNVSIFIYYYDENKTYISVNNTQVTPKTFTTPINAYYVRIRTRQSEDVTDTSLKCQLEKGLTATSYEIYYNYELVKNGNNSDLIFKNEKSNQYYNNTLVENAWYKLEKIKKRFLLGTGNWGTSNNVFYTSDISDYSRENNVPYCNFFAGESNKSSTGDVFGDNVCAFNNSYDYNRFYIKSSKITSISSFLQENKPVLYYLKDTANISYEQITETTLINQLEEINSIIGTGGTIVIETESDEENAQLIVNASALKNWEEEVNE